MDGLLGFMLAGLALVGSPGPATLSLAAAGAAFGARRSLGYMAGIVIGLVGVMGIAAAGVIGVLLSIPGAKPVVIAAAAAYFASRPRRRWRKAPARAAGPRSPAACSSPSSTRRATPPWRLSSPALCWCESGSNSTPR
jgi:threonine/homoserine/homoserine lactone efflux protein